MAVESPAESKRLVSLADALKLVPVGQTKLYDLMNSGEITRIKIGRRSFVTSDSIDSFIDRLTVQAEQAGGAA